MSLRRRNGNTHFRAVKKNKNRRSEIDVVIKNGQSNVPDSGSGRIQTVQELAEVTAFPRKPQLSKRKTHKPTLHRVMIPLKDKSKKRTANAADLERGIEMAKYYVTGPEVAKALGISEGKAYEILRELNKQLKDQGYIVVAGRVPRRYFNEHYYGGVEDLEEMEA